VRQERFSSDLVQDFGVFGFQARPFARGHDDDRNTRDAMGSVAFRIWHSIQYTARG
jgi:hypothetical protein